MTRMIDPSDLDGDDLVNWYMRSPADVEAEREAARRDQYDAFVRSIGAASQPTDPPAPAPDAPETNTVSELGDAGGGGDAGYIQAGYFRPAMSPTMPTPPSGPMVGPPLDARGLPPVGAPPSGFFGRHEYLPALGGYYTDLPAPLNTVMSTPAGWWDIGDGRRVTSDEVERIYAEQNRRLTGQDTTEPTGPVRTVNRWKDGQIPAESQVQPGERELDPTCAPNGGWERDPNFYNNSRDSQRYQAQITHAPGLDYVVRNPGQRPVKFDGCAVWDPHHPLLEAKGPGYEALLPKARQWGFEKSMFDKTLGQADRQAEVASGQPIEWHIAEPGAFPFFNRATEMRQPPIFLRQTPAH